jgi:hypothetical protein
LVAEVGDLDSYDGDPTEFLVTGAHVVRAAFDPHHEAALYLAMTSTWTPDVEAVFAMLANMFVRLGVPAEAIEPAFYAYTTYVLGSVLLIASRRSSDDYLDKKTAAAPVPAVNHTTDEEQARDRDLFEAGLHALLAGLPSLSERART